MPIDEILRLLTRSSQQGSVDVTGNGLRGRVFVGKGGIDLATTSENSDLHRHLVNSGYADEKVLDRITTGETTLAAIAESNVALIELLREMTVESLYQIADRGGDFQVHEGHTTPYASPKTFDLEALLQDAEERRREWTKVSELVPDLHGEIVFQRDLGDREEVAVKLDDWKVLSEIGNGASVKEIADRLGTTQFWTARVAARLVNTGLVVQTEPTEADHEDVAYFTEPANDRVTSPEHREHQPEPAQAEPAQAESAQAESAQPQSAQPESAQPEPNPEPESATPFAAETPPLVGEDDVDPNESWWEEPQEERPVDGGLESVSDVESSDDTDVEEDTEAFLEKVFSELETSEPETSESEAEEGYGLLRRRRMGSLRDFSSDS